MKNIVLIFILSLELILLSSCSTDGQKAVSKILKTDHAKVLGEDNLDTSSIESALKLSTLLKTVKMTYPNDKSAQTIDEKLSQLRSQFLPLKSKLNNEIVRTKVDLENQITSFTDKIDTLSTEQKESVQKRKKSFGKNLIKQQCLFFNHERNARAKKVPPVKIAIVQDLDSKNILFKTILNTLSLNPESYGKSDEYIGKEFSESISSLGRHSLVIDCKRAKSLQKELISIGITFDSINGLKQSVDKIETIQSTGLL